MDPMGNEIIYKIYIYIYRLYRYQYTHIMTYMMNTIYNYSATTCQHRIIEKLGEHGCPCAGVTLRKTARPVRAAVAFGLEFGMTWNEIFEEFTDRKTMASFGQISVFPHVFYSTIDLMTAAKPTGTATGNTRGTATATSSVVT